MDNAIRREELLGDRDSPVLLYENYRLRLLDAGEVPYVSTLSTLRNTDVIIVDIYTSAKNGYEEFGDASCTETVPEGNVKEFGEESEYGGSPLKFSFLTLSKLQAEEKSRVNINACYGLKKRFAGNPLSYAEAGSVMNRLIFDRWPFEGGSLGNIPVFIMVDGKDARNTVMLGIRKNKDTVTSFSIRYFGAKVVGDDWKQIEQFGSLFQDFQGTYMAYCTYDILAEMPNSEIDSDCRISAFLRLAVRWPCSAEDVLSQPPPHAPVTVVVYPGWLDSRIPYSDWSGELRLILALSRALRTRKLDWSEANTNVEPSEVFDKVKNLLKEESSLKAPEETSGFLDFTDRLWVIMTECRSYNMVVAVLRLVFEALRHGFKNTMIKDDNKSQMARFIRDACNNELMLPRLEGLTPVEIMLGMGLERFKRRCVHEILSHEMVANVKELDTFYDTRSSNSLESSADSMFLLYNSLVILAICKQYLRIGAHKIHLLARRILSQFNQMTLPPVSNGITADLLKDFELKLKFDVTLIDVYPNVFKIKTSKEWFLDAVFQKSKQVVGEGIMYFSREPLLEYCDLNCEGDDVKIVNLDKKFERRVTSTGQNIEDFYPAIILSRTRHLPY